MLDEYRVPSPPSDLKIVVRALTNLKPNPSNARTHSRRQIRQIADSIQAFGFNNPVLVDEDGMVRKPDVGVGTHIKAGPPEGIRPAPTDRRR